MRKEMKNGLFLILMASLFIFVIANVNLAAAQDLCNPQITLVNQDPNPAVPNSYVKLLFEISGLEKQACSSGMAVELKPEYPFSLDPGTDPIQTVEGSTYTRGYTTTWMVPYKVRIAENALEGDYQIKLLYHIGSNRNFETSYVEGNFNVTITDALTDFDAVLQEVSGTQISIGIVNTGKNTANSVIVKIPQQENYMTTGISEQIVGNLVAGDYTIVSFSIAQTMQRNATNSTAFRQGALPQAQPLKVKIDYTDGIGKRRSVVKEVQLSSALLQGNATRVMPTSANRYTSKSSGISVWWYAAGVVVVAAAAILAFRKYRSRLHKKEMHGKSSEHVPKWVAEEKTHGKK
jgi:hypothetical protein